MQVKSGHLNIVQCLITDFHCDPLKTNSRGSIPLHYACIGVGDALPVVKYLVSEHHCSPDHTNMFGNNTPVHLASLSGHLVTVKYTSPMNATATHRLTVMASLHYIMQP